MSEQVTDGVEVEGPEEAPFELDEETRARRDAALLHVRRWGDPVLKTKARPVDQFDAALLDEVTRMGLLMNDALGIGLAATQLGVPHRVLVYRVEPESPVNALINPEIEWKSKDTETMDEGCLSLPGVHVEVERAVAVRVRGRDATGGALEIDAEGLEARVIQHEIDHLDGTLVLDRVSKQARKEAMRAMREAQRTPSAA